MVRMKNLIIPIKGRVYLAWAGSNLRVNQHFQVRCQHYAVDFVGAPADGERFKEGIGRSNEEFPIWRRPVIAPADAVVIEAIDGVRDNPGIGEQFCYAYSAVGNAVTLCYSKNRFLVLAHLACGSIRVKAGMKVVQGQQIGECGNSGNSTEPHLHFHVQNHPFVGKGVGIRFFFGTVNCNGSTIKNYGPEKGDIIENVIAGRKPGYFKRLDRVIRHL